MSKKGFLNWNSLANYYSKVNNWDQDKIQEMFIGMITNCDLSKEQVEKIDVNLVRNNALLGDKGINKNSIERFNVVKDSLVTGSVWIGERSR